jgi:transcriptional regulator with XRE-family HTH domain
MTTKPKKSEAVEFLESLTKGPLTIGHLLYSLRKSDEISQVEFAKKLGISKQTLCDIEKERTAVSSARAARFAKKLKFPPAFFIQLALQEELKREGIRLSVKVEVA